uniref:Reverse transcriptase/retrotransposon-derived protein RNase H-like domain-containing protein n=1 Tax=Knipowitschia caucasica TaxID=637954 RepID=A0AAV2JNV0_KNICA
MLGCLVRGWTWCVAIDKAKAFDKAKSALADAALLAHPDPDAPIALTTDASDLAVGAVVEQQVYGAWQPLAFFRRSRRERLWGARSSCVTFQQGGRAQWSPRVGGATFLFLCTPSLTRGCEHRLSWQLCALHSWMIVGWIVCRGFYLDESSAELVFGQPLRVPVEFMVESASPGPGQAIDPFSSGDVLAPAPVHHYIPHTFVPSALQSVDFVFVRRDAHRSPFQPPYDGLFRVLEGFKGFCFGFGRV